MNNIPDRPRMAIGDVYLMDFGGKGRGSEQYGLRPGVVFQNNLGNANSPNIIALPITSSVKKMHLPTHVFLPAADTCLLQDSSVVCENPECMSKERIGRYIGTLSDHYMKKIAEASILATSAIAFLDKETLLHAWERAVRLNTVA